MSPNVAMWQLRHLIGHQPQFSHMGLPPVYHPHHQLVPYGGYHQHPAAGPSGLRRAQSMKSEPTTDDLEKILASDDDDDDDENEDNDSTSAAFMSF